MDPQRWLRLGELYGQLCDLPPEQQRLLLDACEDPDLRRELENLLKQHSSDECILDRPLLDLDTSSTMTLPFLPGIVVADRYRIAGFIGKGGMGEVYQAEDLELKEIIALKTLAPKIAQDARMIARFKREIQLARKVSHPNVCRVFDIARHQSEGSPPQGTYFLTMEFLSGETLAEKLSREGRLNPDTALDLLRQMAEGLEAAHRSAVIHRDFKPSNVMLVAGSGGLRALVTDFGLARSLIELGETAVTQPGHVMGTLDYMAPELFLGQTATTASDVYAFGVVAHEVLLGRKPKRSVQNREYIAPGSLPEDIPAGWSLAIGGCLETEPEKRFQSPRSALAAVTDGVTRPTRRRWRPRPAWVAAIGFALLLLSVVLFRDRLDAWMHPLPQKRFIAVMAWPASPSGALQALLRGVLDAIDNRLVRSEASTKDLLVISPRDVSNGSALRQPKDAVTVLGANLVLAVSLRQTGSVSEIDLKVLDALSGNVLREEKVSSTAQKLNRLPSQASLSAAKLLELPSARTEIKDQEELSQLSPATYQIYSRAEELMSRPNNVGLDEAIESYQKTLDEDPHFALGYAKLALAYTHKFHSKRDGAALTLAGKNAELALHYNPNSAEGELSRALVQLYSGQIQPAMDGISRALQLDPGNPEILLFKAGALVDIDKRREAEDVYRQILAARPNYWPAYNQLASILFREGRYQEATKILAEGSAVAPRVALLLSNLGTMFLLLDRTKDAQDAFQQSLERAPTENAYLNLGSIAFEARDYLKALDYYAKARNLNPRNSLTWRNLADCYEKLGQPKTARENYAKAAELLTESLGIDPRRGSDWMTLGFYDAKLGKRAEAEDALKNAETRGASDVESRFTKAQALALLGRKEEAVSLVLECLKRGLSPVEVQLALDLGDVQNDPRYRRYVASVRVKNNQGGSK